MKWMKLEPLILQPREVQRKLSKSSFLLPEMTMKKYLKGLFSFLPFHTTWVFIEPERMISEFPMAFHQSEQEKIQKNCLELCWNPAHSKNKFIGLSEINLGSWYFRKSP